MLAGLGSQEWDQGQGDPKSSVEKQSAEEGVPDDLTAPEGRPLWAAWSKGTLEQGRLCRACARAMMMSGWEVGRGWEGGMREEKGGITSNRRRIDLQRVRH